MIRSGTALFDRWPELAPVLNHVAGTELNIGNCLVRKSMTAGSLANDFASEVVDSFVGGADLDAPKPRQLRLWWSTAAAAGPTVSTSVDSDLYAAVLVAGHQHGVPVRVWREDKHLIGSGMRIAESFFLPRQLPEPGPLLPRLRLVDDQERFDAYISRIDVPGRIGRSVFRRSEREVFFRLAQDRDWIQIQAETSDGLVSQSIETARFRGRVDSVGSGVVATTDGAVDVPTLRSFGDKDHEDQALESWIWSRVMQRLGI